MQAGPISTFNLVRLGVGLMAKNDENIYGEKGVIINTSSVGNPLLGQVANSATNACIEGLMETWASEFGAQGIRTVLIAHGNIGDESTSTETTSGQPHHFAQMAHLVVTTPYLNSTIIKLDGCINRAA